MTYDNAGEQAAIQAQQVQVTWLEKRSEVQLVWRNDDWKNGVKPVFVMNIQNRSYKINRLYIYIHTLIWTQNTHTYIIRKYTCTQNHEASSLECVFFFFCEALVSLCFLKSLEPLLMRWYWRSYSLFKMAPTSSLRYSVVLCMCSFQAISLRIRFETNSIDQPNSLGLTGWKCCLKAITEGYLFWWYCFAGSLMAHILSWKSRKISFFLRGKKGGNWQDLFVGGLWLSLSDFFRPFSNSFLRKSSQPFPRDISGTKLGLYFLCLLAPFWFPFLSLTKIHH